VAGLAYWMMMRGGARTPGKLEGVT